mmetsp:Transcript_126787/g.353122  ORF Transcript_126787/g.353122 Transcript_126787/m.353122 type:complete len:304 (+) Transcript_126787:170-1081(+)
MRLSSYCSELSSGSTHGRYATQAIRITMWAPCSEWRTSLHSPTLRARIGSAKVSLPRRSRSFFPNHPKSPRCEPPFSADLHSEVSWITFIIRGVDWAAHLLSPLWTPSFNNSARARRKTISASAGVRVAGLFFRGSIGNLHSLCRTTMCRRRTLSMFGVSTRGRFAACASTRRPAPASSSGSLKKAAIAAKTTGGVVAPLSAAGRSAASRSMAFATISPLAARGLCRKHIPMSMTSCTDKVLTTEGPVRTMKGSRPFPSSSCTPMTSGTLAASRTVVWGPPAPGPALAHAAARGVAMWLCGEL